MAHPDQSRHINELLQWFEDAVDWPLPEAHETPRGPTSFNIPDPVAESPTEEIVHRDPNQGQNATTSDRSYPASGDVIAGFRLLKELGRGAFGRVYLAEQMELADRRIALKISTRIAGEIRTLARLQHTNIVPVYSAHRAPPLTVLCMPYFGATTIAGVVAGLVFGKKPTSGKAIVESVRRRQADAVRPTAAVSALDSMSYVDAVLWIGERLADALDHAHERGIIHRDIKPANILIADDGQPMLLDFNLAADNNETVAQRAKVGGTLPYMAPEQVRAFTGETEVVDARADIYSLGIVLYQMLALRLPFPDHVGQTETVLVRMQLDRKGSAPKLRSFNREISPAVESIVHKCLATDATQRYQSAADLRDDIARHRANLPLRVAREPSLRERATKWARRHKQLFSSSAFIAYAAAILLVIVAITVRSSLQARVKRQDQERAAAYRQYEQFLDLADRVKLEAGSPGNSAAVYRLGSEALDRYAATEPGWQERDEIKRLPMAEREQLKSEIGEVAYLTAWAAAKSQGDGENAIKFNAVASGALPDGAKPAAIAQRSALIGIPPSEMAAAIRGDGRATFLRACDLAAHGHHRESLSLLANFVTHHPGDFGGWFLKGRCHDMLGQFEDARTAYSACAALRPLSARPLAARGELSFRNGRDLDQARVDLDRALQLDPDVLETRLVRALVLRALKRNREALAELDRLAADERSPTRVFHVRAQVRELLGDRTGAEADRAELMKREPRDAASLVTRGLARAAKEPDMALADFRTAEHLDSACVEALVNQAWILGEVLNRPEEAIAATDRLLAIYPENQNGRCGRAVLLARIGRTDEAVAEARRCVATAPHPSTEYQAGCVLAIVSAKDEKFREEAIRLVATALLRGFGHKFLLTDDDLKPLRSDDRFRKLVDGVKVMKELGTNK